MSSFLICSSFNICNAEQRWGSFLLAFHSKVVTQHCQSAFSMIKTCLGSCWKMNNAREIACVMNKWQIILLQLTLLHTVCKPVMLHLLGQGVQLRKIHSSLVHLNKYCWRFRWVEHVYAVSFNGGIAVSVFWGTDDELETRVQIFELFECIFWFLFSLQFTKQLSSSYPNVLTEETL